MSKIVGVIQSYLPHKSPQKKRSRFIKWCECGVEKKICWQVVEYSEYPCVRKKKVLGKDIEVGIHATCRFLVDKTYIYRVLVLAADNVSDLRVPKLICDCFDVVLVVQNIGLDLGAHQEALRLLSIQYMKNRQSPLILTNSSFVPHSEPKILRLASAPLCNESLIGVSFSFGPRYYLLKPLHLQSFFLLSSCHNLLSIFEHLELSNNNKYKVIRDGELSISRLAVNHGLSLVCYDGELFHVFNEILFRVRFYDHRAVVSSMNTL